MPEKVAKKKLTIAVDKIESQTMKEINTGDHKISREIVAPKVEQKKTLKNRINTVKDNLEIKKDRFVDGIKREKSFAKLTLKEASEQVDVFADRIMSSLKLGTIGKVDLVSQEVDDVLKEADRIQVKGLVSKLKFLVSKKHLWLQRVVEQISNSLDNADGDTDYGLGDRPIVSKEKIEEDNGRWPN